MGSKSNAGNEMVILSPVTGKAVALEQVPDPVFSQKIIGDGMAVIPEDGRILSPVTGEVASVADTFHAFGFRTDDGLELLVHVGLETVALKGECFKVHVKAGDRIQAGELVAEVDLAFLAERQINPITPVLICGGMEGKSMEGKEGFLEAGKDVLMSIAAEASAAETGSQDDAGANSAKSTSGATGSGKPDKKNR